MDRMLKILGFAGSLRKGSYNKALLHTARDSAPKDVEIEIFDLEGFRRITRTWTTTCLQRSGNSRRR